MHTLGVSWTTHQSASLNAGGISLNLDFDFESLGSVTSRMALYRKVSEQSFLLQHVWEDNTLAEQGFDASIV